MVERVARAMRSAITSDSWDDLVEGSKEDFRCAARAAIAAMREPTGAMIESCGNGECAKWAPGAWQLMIDAASAPKEEPAS